MSTIPVRLRWHPSRYVLFALCAFGLLGAVGAWASDMPRPVAILVGAGSLALGVLRAHRECRQRPCVLAIDAAGVATLGGIRLASLVVHWRGPLAFLVAGDEAGRVHRRAFWPDVLDAEGRRVLRLVSTAHHTPAVAG